MFVSCAKIVGIGNKTNVRITRKNGFKLKPGCINYSLSNEELNYVLRV